jgi:LPXTG-site transpeptidase (sortase) family protein
MDLRLFIKNHKKWFIPTIIALFVFIFSQIIISSVLLIQDNPLPDIAPTNPVVSPSIQAQPSDTIINDQLEAEVVIPHLSIGVPIVWSTSKNNTSLEKDLENGAIHYPDTPKPGNFGNSFITAHSSDYPWKAGAYKRAFAKLGELSVGDKDIFVVYKKNGKPIYQAQFKVTSKEVVKDTDARMIEQQAKTEMTLVTCWPIGTNWRRLMVKTELISINTI